MPIMSFNFTGWCRADITTVFDGENDIDVSNMPASELAKKLNNGTYTIPFAQVYADAATVENDITDYTPWSDDNE